MIYDYKMLWNWRQENALQSHLYISNWNGIAMFMNFILIVPPDTYQLQILPMLRSFLLHDHNIFFSKSISFD